MVAISVSAFWSDLYPPLGWFRFSSTLARSQDFMQCPWTVGSYYGTPRPLPSWIWNENSYFLRLLNIMTRSLEILARFCKNLRWAREIYSIFRESCSPCRDSTAGSHENRRPFARFCHEFGQLMSCFLKRGVVVVARCPRGLWLPTVCVFARRIGGSGKTIAFVVRRFREKRHDTSSHHFAYSHHWVVAKSWFLRPWKVFEGFLPIAHEGLLVVGSYYNSLVCLSLYARQVT